ncbi:MAG: SRPBCC family protein [Candidatus Kariarchaeaceae archaeon]
MYTLTDTIDIKTSPQAIFNWFQQIEDNYLDWHSDHISCKWLKGNSFEIGSVLYAEEYLHGKIHKMKFETTKVISNEYIEYKNKFPISLISPSGSFTLIEEDNCTKFTATLEFRFGWLLSKIVKKQMNSLINHMKEEGEELKKILEEGQD